MIAPDAVEEIGTVAPLLRHTWGLVFGGCPDDRHYLPTVISHPSREALQSRKVFE